MMWYVDFDFSDDSEAFVIANLATAQRLSVLPQFDAHLVVATYSRQDTQVLAVLQTEADAIAFVEALLSASTAGHTVVTPAILERFLRE